MSKLNLLLSYREDFIKVLSVLTTDALLRVSKDLLRYGVITPDNMETLSSLDHPRLDSGTIVRYLLQLVYERIQLDSTLCNKFLEVMASNREKGVAQVCKAITDQLASCTEGLEAKPGDVTKGVLLESDVGELWESLIEISHKWEEIAVLLKLPRATIKECQNASSNNLKLYKVLMEWVCGSHKQVKPPTLSHLKHALASPVVGELDMVKKLYMVPMNVPSSEKQMVVKEIPFVVQFQSVNTEVGECMSTLLEVQVPLHDSVSYQWMKDDQPLSDSSTFSGTHSAILLIRNASPITQGQYYCHVSAGKEELTSSHVTVTVIYPPDKLALLKYYSNLNEVPGDSWPLVSPSTFIDLALIKTGKIKKSDGNFVEGEMGRILQRRHKVDYSEAFCDYQRGALLLVEGRPGSGKTTLAHKITKDWAMGNILKHVSKLFFVSLRRDYDKLDIFSTFFSSKSELYINELEGSLGEGVCFVLEGYDEYSNKDRQESIINKLIHKSYLPLAMVIVTSRPLATATLRPKATSIVEILGFTREQFDNFIDSYLFQDLVSKEELESVKSHLKASTDVMNMCYLPLNASILCFLYGHLQGQQFPKTETQVYDQLVRAILLRKLRIANDSVKLYTLKALPEIETRDFSQLCYVAFHMTVDCKQIVKELPVLFKTSAVTSLLTIDKIVTQAGLEEVYSFLHLTLQEFLAAYHLANLDQHQQAEMIKLHSGKDHMLNTFKFYCGLVDPELIIKQFRDVVKNGGNILYMFHCAYQTQCDSICSQVLEILGGEINLPSIVLTPVDFCVLGYVISNASDRTTTVSTEPCLLYEDYNSAKWLNIEHDTSDVMLYNFDSTNATSNLTFWENVSCAQISYAIKSKDIIEKFNGWQNTRHSTNLIKTYKTVLHYESYSSDLFASKSAGPFIEALKRCINLKLFEIVSISKCMKSTRAIADILKRCVNIETFHIIGDYNFFGVTSLTTGLLHCKNLQFLWLTNIDLSSDIAAISSVITHCEHMKTLWLIKCSISPEGAEQLAHAIADRTLEELNLAMNNIRSAGIRHLSPCLGEKPNCKVLILADNGIDSSGIKVLAEVLHSFTKLKHINLSYNDVGLDGAAALVQGLKSCIVLNAILLNHCNLTGCGIVLISEILHILKNIVRLDFSSNGIISVQDALELADSLSSSELLQHFNLSDNGIDCESAMALSQGIIYCSNLITLDLSNNSIGSDGIAAISASIQSKQMELADFSRNRIGKDSADSIAVMAKSRYIERLDLSHNKIESTGVKHLLTKLATYQFPMKINLLCNNTSSQDIDMLKDLCENTSLQVLLTI